MEVRNTIQEAEHSLNHALHLNQLETIASALALAQDKPVDCKLVHQCALIKAKLESEIELGKVMQIQTISNLDEFGPIHEALTKAIEDAEVKNADQGKIAIAKTLRRKLMSEASLMRAVEGPQKTTTGHIIMLEELTSAARGENAKEDLLVQATRLIAKLKSEREVQRRIAETAPLCAGDQENLPSWCHESEQFEEFHKDYKMVVETAERDQISSSLMSTALEQLASIELILIQKKQAEDEQRLKD
eukprot:UN0846